MMAIWWGQWGRRTLAGDHCRWAG